MSNLLLQWQSIRHTPFTPEVEVFRHSLCQEVCKHYGWLASELFELEGELGFGPGVREYDGDFFPEPTKTSSAQMEAFLRRLPTLAQDTELARLIMKCSRADSVFVSPLETLVSNALNASLQRRSNVVNYLYSTIACHRDCYTLGAARMYAMAWRNDETFYGWAVAGLARLLAKPITKTTVALETAKRHLSYVRQQVEEQVATEQLVLCSV